MREVSSQLLADVKNYLDITWDDEATNRKIKSLVSNGMHYLGMKGGSCLDYEGSGLANMLLKDYVRYARDSALDVFENNYMSMILALQTDRQVDRYVEETE